MVGAESCRRPADLGLRILDVLGFIDKDEMKGMPLQLLDISMEKRKGGQDQIGISDLAKTRFATRSLEDQDRKVGSKLPRLALPIDDDAGRGNDEAWFPLVSSRLDFGEDVSQRLQSFP